ncbi:hypothetical protein Sjap_013085 [Stephania japonica]|uniref:Uncharacterized protein n=1 Tax=Stephania japonica TaxID=461633 RepID=A0AAP0IZ10_9MAGN
MADNLNDGEDVQLVDGEDVQLVDEEEEVEESALFHSYPVYYVQSPSNTSHAYSDSKTFNQHDSSFPSPIPHTANDPANATQDVSRFVLLSYSSSRASTNSFHHHFKNAASYELQVHGGAAGNDCKRGDQDDHDEVDDNDEDYEVVDSNNDRGSNGGRKYVNDIALVRPGSKRRGCWRFFSFSTSSSSCWIAIQLFWRLMVSVGAALLVFYLATKPPPPKMFVKNAAAETEKIGFHRVHRALCTGCMLLQVQFFRSPAPLCQGSNNILQAEQHLTLHNHQFKHAYSSTSPSKNRRPKWQGSPICAWRRCRWVWSFVQDSHL